jgi:hypothetical protein
MAPLRNLFMGMPPMLDALAQQTNVQLPSFLPQVRASLRADMDSTCRGISCWHELLHHTVAAFHDLSGALASVQQQEHLLSGRQHRDCLLRSDQSGHALPQVKAQEPTNGGAHLAAHR